MIRLNDLKEPLLIRGKKTPTMSDKSTNEIPL